eukprot:669032-Rhodomonas_salina.1
MILRGNYAAKCYERAQGIFAQAPPITFRWSHGDMKVSFASVQVMHQDGGHAMACGKRQRG